MKKLLLIIIIFFSLHALHSQNERDVKEAKGLPVGDIAPKFVALDADSNMFILNEALQDGPVVLIFYRGFWCPVCNKHLGKLQDSLQFIQEAGARVIAVSPEKPDYLDKMAEKSGAGFTLLYDEGYKIADAYDVTFKPTSMQLFSYNVVLNGELKKSHSDESQLLPIPATYILNRDGTILWRQFDPDYKKRSSVNEIIEELGKIDQRDFNGNP